MSRKILLTLFIMTFALPTLAQGPVIPTVPVQQQMDNLTGAANNVNQMPASVTNSNLPTSPNPMILFGYVRWLFSYDTAQELLGRKIAPLGLALFHFLMVIIPLLTLYLLINITVAAIKFAAWVFNITVKLIELTPLVE